MPIKPDTEFSFICHHPFITSTHFFIDNKVVDLTSSNEFNKVIELYEDQIDKATELWGIVHLFNKAYLGIFFKMIYHYLSDEDYKELLVYTWVSEEYPNTDVNVSQKDWIGFWKKIKPTNLAQFDDEIVIYRGLMKNASYKALS